MPPSRLGTLLKWPADGTGMARANAARESVMVLMNIILVRVGCERSEFKFGGRGESCNNNWLIYVVLESRKGMGGHDFATQSFFGYA